MQVRVRQRPGSETGSVKAEAPVRIRTRQRKVEVQKPFDLKSIPPKRWPVGSEWVMGRREYLYIPQAKRLMGWNIREKDGYYRWWRNESGRPVYVGRFASFYEGAQLVTDWWENQIRDEAARNSRFRH